ncbi:MAG: ABC transporter substrate-binding protein [bacterium]|nr:ABC transporter substrate-binding protein [bacterium]
MAATPRRIALTVVLLSGLALLSFVAGRVLRPQTETPPFPTGEIRIAVDASYPPFAVVQDAELAGFEIDLGSAIGARLGLPVRFVNISYDGLYDALISGQVDVVISQLLVNPLRMGDVRYTRAYFDAGLVLISSSATPIGSISQIPGKRLALEFGSAADAEARLWTRRVRPFEMRPYELTEYALDAVRLGEADAALTDAISARLYLRAHSEWNTHLAYVTQAPFAAAVALERASTWKAIENAISALMEDGTLDHLLSRWL